MNRNLSPKRTHEKKEEIGTANPREIREQGKESLFVYLARIRG